MKNRFLGQIARAQNVLLVGAGGGYDIFSGLPLYRWLRATGKTVHLTNLSSGALAFTDEESPIPGLFRITSTTAATQQFPEMHLAGWLSRELKEEVPVFCIEPSGARPVSAAIRWLADNLRPDAIVLVDGGTDSLMRGDEAGLGTPEGDMVSLLAVNSLPGAINKFIVCLGFGIDSHHGVCHAHVLENISALMTDDGFLGAWNLDSGSEEFAFFRAACDYVFARLPRQPSIVNTSIIAAATGEFGNHHSTRRTEGSTLFINPLMALYWAFRLELVAGQNLMLKRIEQTETATDVAREIERFRDELPSLRSWQPIPC
jgi:hypothetical protein